MCGFSKFRRLCAFAIIRVVRVFLTLTCLCVFLMRRVIRGFSVFRELCSFCILSMIYEEMWLFNPWRLCGFSLAWYALFQPFIKCSYGTCIFNAWRITWPFDLWESTCLFNPEEPLSLFDLLTNHFKVYILLTKKSELVCFGVNILNFVYFGVKKSSSTIWSPQHVKLDAIIVR